MVVRKRNRVIKYWIQHRISLKIRDLEIDTLCIIGQYNSSFANCSDLFSQLAHICFSCDSAKAVAPMHFESYKALRVSESTMSAEVIFFSDFFEIAVPFTEEMEMILSRKIPVPLLTDSKFLFDVLSKGSRSFAKRMMLDITAARQVLRKVYLRHRFW